MYTKYKSTNSTGAIIIGRFELYITPRFTIKNRMKQKEIRNKNRKKKENKKFKVVCLHVYLVEPPEGYG